MEKRPESSAPDPLGVGAVIKIGKTKPFIITLEDHYWDRELVALFADRDGKRPQKIQDRMYDVGALRLKDMDEAGIDLQILSHGSPGVQLLEAETAVGLARETNDRLHQLIQAHPKRFAAFATLPTPDPKAAADELERVVTKLGFKGAMLHGLTHGRLFIDDKRFWPIFERAQALDVPLYIHPAYPPAEVIDVYYGDYASRYPSIIGPVQGYTVESSTQAIRLVLSGAFDAYPRLKFVLGHLGEGLPAMLWRIDRYLPPLGPNAHSFSEIFRQNFYITTSGNFSTSSLLCSVMELSVDRIMFSVDWPYDSNLHAVEWMNGVPLSPDDKHKIFGGNAKRLLRID